MQEDISEDHHEEGKVHSWEVGQPKSGVERACHKGGGKSLQ